MINLTDNALTEIKRLKSHHTPSHNYLRIKVSEGGCADLFYQLHFDDQTALHDRTFTQYEDVVIIVDEQSYKYVENLVIDYAEDLMGGAFQYKNPLVKNHCSCGISFSSPESD